MFLLILYILRIGHRISRLIVDFAEARVRIKSGCISFDRSRDLPGSTFDLIQPTTSLRLQIGLVSPVWLNR